MLEALREANAAAIAGGESGEGAASGGRAARDGRGATAAAQSVEALPDWASVPVCMFGWDVEAAAPMEVLSLRRAVSTARAGSERSSESSGSEDSSIGGGDKDDEVVGGGGGGDGGGGDGDGGGASTVVQAYVVELLSAKLEAMQASAEIACAMMGVDGVLVDGR